MLACVGSLGWTGNTSIITVITAASRLQNPTSLSAERHYCNIMTAEYYFTFCRETLLQYRDSRILLLHFLQRHITAESYFFTFWKHITAASRLHYPTSLLSSERHNECWCAIPERAHLIVFNVYAADTGCCLQIKRGINILINFLLVLLKTGLSSEPSSCILKCYYAQIRSRYFQHRPPQLRREH